MKLLILILLSVVVAASCSWSLIDDLCKTTPIAKYMYGWCSETVDRCDWEGIRCSRGMLSYVDVKNVPFNIELPDSFYAPSPSVTTIIFRNCSLNGEIKPVTEMLKFSHLDLSDNNLSGSLPHGFATQFSSLNISYNKLKGSISLCSTNLGTVTSLSIAHNKFSEDLTACFVDSVRSLVRFEINDNIFYGRAPTAYGANTYDISNNQFYSINVSPLKAPPKVPSIPGLPPIVLKEHWFRLCNVSGNPFTQQAPKWMTPFYEKCQYNWNPQNTRYDLWLTKQRKN